MQKLNINIIEALIITSMLLVSACATIGTANKQEANAAVCRRKCAELLGIPEKEVLSETDSNGSCSCAEILRKIQIFDAK